MKVIYILILFIFLLVQKDFVNGLTDIEAAKSIYEEIYGPSPTYDPCSLTSKFFICEQDVTSGSKYVFAIYLEVYDLTSNDPITLTTDFSPFTKVNITLVNDPIRVSDSFFNNVNKMVSLKEISIQTQTSEISSSVVFPPSVYLITINNMGTKVPLSFFSTGKISIKIQKAIPGYSIDSTITCPSTPREYSLNMELPISNLGSLPTNFFTCVLHPLSLKLNVMNKKNSAINPNNQVFPLPALALNQSHLTQLTYNFEATNLEEAILLNYEPSLGKLDLYSFSILNVGFQVDPQLGYFELPNSFNTIVFDHIGSTLFGQCTKKPCVKSSYRMYIKIYYGDYYLENIDFSNIGGFSSSYNTFSQSIPNDIDTTSLNSFSFTDSAVYGDVPSNLINVASLSLINNGMNGTVPSPFICQGGNSNRFVLVQGNSFTNFNIDTEPYCPNFFIEPITDKLIFDTAGKDSLLIKGIDIGKHYSKFSNFSTYSTIKPIINEELLYPIERGVGKNHSMTLYFQKEFSFPFTFNYDFAAPSIKAYKAFGVTLYLLGTGFDYTAQNLVTLNGVPYNSSIAYDNFTYFNYENLKDGQALQFKIDVGGQTDTATFTFVLVQFSIMQPANFTYQLYSSGGELTLFMDRYSISKISSVNNLSFYIGDKQETVLSIQRNGVRVKYSENDYYLLGSYEKPKIYLIDNSTGVYSDTTVFFIDDQWDSSDDTDSLVSLSHPIATGFNLIVIFVFSIILVLN